MINFKNICTVAVIAGSLFTFAPKAMAGEGGIAGSASFLIDGTNVTEASTAIAVGKSTAYAGATTAGTTTEAFAAGTGGTITFTGTDIYIDSIAQDTALGTAQANELDDQTININVVGGTNDLVN
jgi:hypothetical protein